MPPFTQEYLDKLKKRSADIDLIHFVMNTKKLSFEEAVKDISKYLEEVPQYVDRKKDIKSQFDTTCFDEDLKKISFCFLESQDEYLVSLLNIHGKIEETIDLVREGDRDRELEDELVNINNRLTNEIGVRLTMVYS